VVEEEYHLLKHNGHDVKQFIVSNSMITQQSLQEKVRVTLSIRKGYSPVIEKFIETLERFMPDVCHVHNEYLLLSPYIIEIISEYRIPIVKTLHNYRLLCANSYLYRDGKICELCVGKNMTYSILYRCYRDSYIQSAILADSIQYHRRKNTMGKVSAFIALSKFARQKFIEGGLDSQNIFIKPNFVSEKKIDCSNKKYFLFVGRLTREKGFDEFLKLAKALPAVNFVAVGPLECNDILSSDNIEFLGPQTRDEVFSRISNCTALLFLSRLYEGMPMSIIEAFSLGKPVIARNHGAMSSMIKDQFNGLLYTNFHELEEQVQYLQGNPQQVKMLGENAYETYLENYSPNKAYKELMKIYERVLNEY
jgi:glycosyltransferase involved in cell wall biosynthesis